MLLRKGDKIGLIACSNGRRLDQVHYIELLTDTLIELGFIPVFAKTIYQINDTPFSGTPHERAGELMKFYCDDEIKAIIDLSGGDTANQVLPHLDYSVMTSHPKPFIGISDLSVLLNAIYVKTGQKTYHYQIGNLVGDDAIVQKELFKKRFMEGQNKITFDYHFLRGHVLKGKVIGGNIRCFLKLAGTEYLPTPNNCILFLESLGGGIARMASLLAQLDQIGYLKQCNGILLGTFTEVESSHTKPTIEELVLELTKDYNIPVVKTTELGHGPHAHCITIGEEIELVQRSTI